MKIPASKTMLVGALILGCGLAPAAGAGELIVTRQKDGTLLITNTGVPNEAMPVSDMKEGAAVKEVQPPAAVREEAIGLEAPPQAAPGNQTVAPVEESR